LPSITAKRFSESFTLRPPGFLLVCTSAKIDSELIGPPRNTGSGTLREGACCGKSCPSVTLVGRLTMKPMCCSWPIGRATRMVAP
jgi:hypothetical protein